MKILKRTIHPVSGRYLARNATSATLVSDQVLMAAAFQFCTLKGVHGQVTRLRIYWLLVEHQTKSSSASDLLVRLR